MAKITPIRTDMTTHELGKPADWDEAVNGPCETLPVVRNDAAALSYSYWRIPFGHRLAILFGVPLRLCVASYTHPAVSLDVTSK